MASCNRILAFLRLALERGFHFMASWPPCHHAMIGPRVLSGLAVNRPRSRIGSTLLESRLGDFAEIQNPFWRHRRIRYLSLFLAIIFQIVVDRVVHKRKGFPLCRNREFIFNTHTEKMIRRWLLPLILYAAALLPGSVASAQTGVSAVLPNGRAIHPEGNWIPLAPYPFALAVRADGAEIAVPSIGFPFALNVIDQPSGSTPAVRRMPAGAGNDPAVEVHAGLAYSPDGALLYVATGDSGKIRAYRTSDWQPEGEVSLNGAGSGSSAAEAKFEGSFAATLIVSAYGKTLYALDQGNWRVVLVDAAKMERIASIPTGRYPFGLALSPDGTRLYVTNTGLFEYHAVPGAGAKEPLTAGLHFPPFGYPSREESATLRSAVP